MKVMIPVKDNNGGKSDLAKGFHNAEFVCIYDTQSKDYNWMHKTEMSKDGGNLSQVLKQNEIFTIISNNIPLMALGLFVDNGLNVLKAKSDKLEENIEFFIKNQLEPYTSLNSREASSCGGSCGSCSSTTCN